MTKNIEDYTPVKYTGDSLTHYTHPNEKLQDITTYHGALPFDGQVFKYDELKKSWKKQMDELTKTKSVHFSSAKGDWRTPKYVLEWLKPFGAIGLDPCASSEAGAEMIGEVNFKETDDGLSQDWGQGFTFVNPVYGRKIHQWTDKAVAEAKLGAEIILLLPARPDTAWWQRMVQSANAVCFVKGRIKFEGAKHSAPFPSALVYFGSRSTLFVDSLASRGWCIQTS